MSLVIERSEDLETCLDIRFAVFVREQNVPVELEQDEYDATALHVLARENGSAVGTARIILSGETGKIGRVAVLASQRGTGLGRKLIEACLDELSKLPEITTAKLGSQIHALGFYEKLGFVAEGPEFDDAGIPHKMMSRPV